jgi:hypothetical protein
MKNVLLGHDLATGQPVHLPVAAWPRHLHLPGSTGVGKTTALLTLLYQLLCDPYHRACHFVVDFLGGLTYDLLLWMSSKYCPPWVRERLVLIRPGRKGVVLPMNPLVYEDEDQGFFKVNRAMDLLLRAWQAQNLGEQPRLARWMFNALWAVAQLGLTIADSFHLLLPRSPFHEPLLAALPSRLQLEWRELLDERGSKKTEILDSTRNRLKPFYESGILRSMFGSTAHCLDMLRFMREQKIVILDVAPYGRLAPQESNAIAMLLLHELLATARSLPRHLRYPTYCWLDECQRAVSPDLEMALPEVRQLQIALTLAHQSFAQLKRGDIDLTSLIFLANTRLVFAEQGEDAEILAQELATIAYNPKWIKDELYVLKQLEAGKRVVELSSWGTAHTDARQWGETYGQGWQHQQSTARRDGETELTRNEGSSRSGQEGRSRGGSASDAHTHSVHQQLISELETIRELSSRTYYGFEEQRTLMAQVIRTLKTGECLAKLWNDPRLYHVRVKETRPGYLGFPPETLLARFPEVMAAYVQLEEVNFQRGWFVSPEQVAQETEVRLQRVLKPVLTVVPPQPAPSPDSMFGV